MLAEAPVFRRWLQACLVFDHGKHPVAVTNALANLRGGLYDLSGVQHEEIRYAGDSKATHLYCYERPPRPSELKYLSKLVRIRQTVFEKNRLGLVGEQFTRSALIASDCYVKVTPKARLGILGDAFGKNKLDLRATDRNGVEYGISVRNRQEHLHRNQWIDDIVVKAAAHGVTPWLVVPFATAEGRERCRAANVRLTVLGAQIVQARQLDGKLTTVLIERLRPIIGPQPVHCVNVQFDPEDPIAKAFREGSHE